MKRCYRCGEVKEPDQFDADPKRKDGRRAACRACGCEMARIWYRKNKDRARQNQRRWAAKNREYRNARSLTWYHANKSRLTPVLRRQKAATKYGLTHAEFAELVMHHHGMCAICSRKTKRLMLDHCHKTKRVRGLLCQSCNAALGLFADSRERLQAAIGYLEKAEAI